MQNVPLFELSYSDQLGEELRAMLPAGIVTAAAARGDFTIAIPTDDVHTLSVRPSLTGKHVDLVFLTNGAAGLGVPAARLENLPPLVVAGIVTGWLEALFVQFGRD